MGRIFYFFLIFLLSKYGREIFKIFLSFHFIEFLFFFTPTKQTLKKHTLACAHTHTHTLTITPNFGLEAD